MITKITVKTKSGTELELDMEDAQGLYEALREIFYRPPVIPARPDPQPAKPWGPQAPWWQSNPLRAPSRIDNRLSDTELQAKMDSAWEAAAQKNAGRTHVCGD